MTSSDPREFAFAFQPILDRVHTIIGMELLYRDRLDLRAAVDNPTTMSAGVIISAFIHASGDAAHCRYNLFFNIGEELLMSEMLEFLPRMNVTLQLPASLVATPPIIERCQQLKTRGYAIALDHFTGDPAARAPLLEVADFVKIDLQEVQRSSLPQLIEQLSHWKVKLLAEKVETAEDAAYCHHLGFSMFQGYYFARPTFIEGKRPDPAKLTVVNLLAQLMADAHGSVIEETFRENPGLVYHLLRLVNTAAFGTSTKIGSIRQALNLLGRNQLIRWIQLLLYSLDDNGGFPSALLQLAAKRGKLMELLAQHASHELGTFQERSHMAGMLSLADALLGMPMDEVVLVLNPEDALRDALLERKGPIGLLLSLCENLDIGDFDQVESLAGRLHIPMQTILQCQGEAMAWVCMLSGPAH